MAKTRDTYFDLLQCVAMFMVVVSHVQSYRPGFSFSAMPAASLNFIMVVNMPLFLKFPKVANVIFGGR